METALHIMMKFQFDCGSLQRRDASETSSVSNNIARSYSTQTFVIAAAAREAGSMAELEAARKSAKYTNSHTHYTF